MRRAIVLTLFTALLSAAPAFAQQADITQVIPAKSLVVVMARNPQVAEDHIGAMVGKIGGAAPPKGFILDDMLRELGLYSREAAAQGEKELPTTFQRTSPLAMVVLPTPIDQQGPPLGMIVQVSDYRKFLQELVQISGAAGAEVTPDGTDVIKGNDKTAYVAPVGGFAVFSASEWVVKMVKTEAQKPIATAGIASLKKTIADYDVAACVNLDEIVRTYAVQINAAKMMILNQMQRNANANAPIPPEKMAKIIGAYFDAALKLGGQVDALVVGVKFSGEAADAKITLQPVADTMLARMAAGFKDAPTPLVSWLEGPAVLVAGVNVEPVVKDEAIAFLTDMIKNAGFIEGQQVDQFIADMTKLAGLYTGDAAFMLAEPEAGKPLIRGVGLQGVKPNSGDEVRKLEESLSKIWMTASPFTQGPVKPNIELSPGAETHRGFRIDRTTISFNFDTQDLPPNVQQNLRKLMDTLYGSPMTVYEVIVKDTRIQTVGDPTTATIKACMDRLLDGKKSAIEQEPMVQASLAGMPAKRAGWMAFGLAEFMKQVLPVTRPQLQGLPAAMDALKFEKVSGVGITCGPGQGGCALDVNVPVQEMLNIKAVVMTMVGAMFGAMQ